MQVQILQEGADGSVNVPSGLKRSRLVIACSASKVAIGSDPGYPGWSLNRSGDTVVEILRYGFLGTWVYGGEVTAYHRSIVGLYEIASPTPGNEPIVKNSDMFFSHALIDNTDLESKWTSTYATGGGSSTSISQTLTPRGSFRFGRIYGFWHSTVPSTYYGVSSVTFTGKISGKNYYHVVDPVAETMSCGATLGGGHHTPSYSFKHFTAWIPPAPTQPPIWALGGI